MVQYKCINCGGQMKLNNSGSFICPYCGSESFMSDSDFKGNEEFRKKLLLYAKAKAEEAENDYSHDSLWKVNGTDSYVMANSAPLNISYMFKYTYPDCLCYIVKESVVYIFENEADASAFIAGRTQLVFPEADTKLSRCFPQLKMEITLQGRKKALVYTRKPGFYPAELFAPWPSEHLAWVISRMENFCCTFEYSGISFNGIDSKSVFINPTTHEGALFGDWRLVEKKNGNSDLADLRKAAILLAQDTSKPKELHDFLMSSPAADAYDDFAKWDTVIEKGFGGHKFVKM